MTEDVASAISVPIVWVGVEDLPVRTSNQVLAQVDRDNVFLTFGVVTPPVVIADTPDALREQVERLSYVPVQAHARLAVSRRHLGELIDLLQRTAINFDNQPGEPT